MDRNIHLFIAFVMNAGNYTISASIVIYRPTKTGNDVIGEGSSQKDSPGPVMVSDTLALLCISIIFSELKQGSGPEGDEVL